MNSTDAVPGEARTMGRWERASSMTRTSMRVVTSARVRQAIRSGGERGVDAGKGVERESVRKKEGGRARERERREGERGRGGEGEREREKRAIARRAKRGGEGGKKEK